MRLLGILLFLLVVACAWSQTGAPKEPHGPYSKQTAQTGGSPGNKPISAIPAVQRTERTDKVERETAGHSREPAPDWITALTAVLALCAVVQIIVMIVNARQMKRVLKLTKQSADAAQSAASVAERDLTMSKRAYVRFGLVEVTPYASDPPCWCVKCEMENVGSTPAHITYCHAEMTFSNKQGVPALPSAGELFERDEDRRYPMMPGEKRTEDFVYKLTREQMACYVAGQRIAVFAIIRYKDVFNESHLTRFGVWNDGGWNSLPIDEPGYNEAT